MSLPTELRATRWGQPTALMASIRSAAASSPLAHRLSPLAHRLSPSRPPPPALPPTASAPPTMQDIPGGDDLPDAGPAADPVELSDEQRERMERNKR